MRPPSFARILFTSRDPLDARQIVALVDFAAFLENGKAGGRIELQRLIAAEV